MIYVTIDPYYDIGFFNEVKEALKNNGVDYEIFLSIKAPYYWYFKLEREPLMVNYEIAPKQKIRWLVSVVQPLRSNDEYLLYRRNNDYGQKALLKFIENKPFKQARLSDYAVLFTIKNREEGELITREYPGKVWFLGKYYKNRYRVCLATNMLIRGFLSEDQILLEKNKELSEPGRLESEFNWKVLRNFDALKKFTETPYFQDGRYVFPRILREHSNRFIL